MDRGLLWCVLPASLNRLESSVGVFSLLLLADDAPLPGLVELPPRPEADFDGRGLCIRVGVILVHFSLPDFEAVIGSRSPASEGRL